MKDPGDYSIKVQPWVTKWDVIMMILLGVILGILIGSGVILFVK